MPEVLERPRGNRAQHRPRAPRLGQPESLAALRPSQRRAAINRARRTRQSLIGYWLRRLPRP